MRHYFCLQQPRLKVLFVMGTDMFQRAEPTRALDLVTELVQVIYKRFVFPLSRSPNGRRAG